MSKKQAQLPILTGDQLRKRIAARAVQLVEVASLGGRVRVVRPSFERLVEIKSKNLNEADERLAVLAASCPDLSIDDLKLLKEGDGIAVASLLAAVTKPITDDDVAK
jgi:hypothetical protein